MSTYFKLGSLIKGIATTVTSGGTLTLTASSKIFQQLTGTSNHTVALPNATTLPVGRVFTILNRSTGTITVNNNGGAAIATIGANSQKDFIFTDVSTSNGTIATGQTGGSGGTSVTSTDKLNLLKGLSVVNFESSTIKSKKILFNPEEIGGNAWVSKTSLPETNMGQAGSTLNGYGYVTSGYSVQQRHARYDQDNNYWITRTNIPVSSQAFSAAGLVTNSALYVTSLGAGGINANPVYQYSDTANTWTAKGNLPANRQEARAIVLSNAYLVGGATDGGIGDGVNTTYQYNAAGDTWYLRANLLSSRAGFCGFALENFGYVASGNTAGAANGTLLSTSEMYDEAKNTWQSIASVVTPRNVIGSGNLKSLGTGYLPGGFSSNALTSVVANMERYIPASNLWSVVNSSAVTNVAGQGVFELNGSLFSAGGDTSSYTNPSSTLQFYKNFNYFSLGKMLVSNASPTSILVGSATTSLVTGLPVQIRTDGNTWKTLFSNIDSVTRFGDTLQSKFREYGLGYAVDGNNGGFTAFLEFYNRQQNVWINKTSSPAQRSEPGAFGLNGSGYVFGGVNGGGLPTTTEKYNPITDSYTSAGSNANATRGPQTFVLNGFGYSAGGYTTSGVTNVSKYDPTLDSWSPTTAVPSAVYYQGAGFDLHNYGYVCGGSNDGSSGTSTASVVAFEDVTNTWVTRASLSAARFQNGSFRIGDFGYTASGKNSGGSALNTTEKYDPQANSWSTLSNNVPDSVFDRTGFSTEGYGYLAGGFNPSNVATTQELNAENLTWTTKANLNNARGAMPSGYTPGSYRKYDLRVGMPEYIAGVGGNVWVSKANCNLARQSLSNSNFGLNGYVYRPGGQNGGDKHDTERYNPQTNVWTNDAAINNDRSSFASFLVGGFGYLAQGSVNGTTNNNGNKYNDVTQTWTATASSSRTTLGPAGCGLNGFGYTYRGSSNGTDQYNPSSDSWTTKTAGNAGQFPGGFALVGFAYAIGGESGYVSQRYNDAADSWTTITSTITNASQNGTFALKGKGYYAGGTPNGSTATASTKVEEYNPDSNIWTAKTGLNGNRIQNGTGVAQGSGYVLDGINSSSTILNTVEQMMPSLNAIELGAAIEVK